MPDYLVKRDTEARQGHRDLLDQQERMVKEAMMVRSDQGVCQASLGLVVC